MSSHGSVVSCMNRSKPTLPSVMMKRSRRSALLVLLLLLDPAAVLGVNDGEDTGLASTEGELNDDDQDGSAHYVFQAYDSSRKYYNNDDDPRGVAVSLPPQYSLQAPSDSPTAWYTTDPVEGAEKTTEPSSSIGTMSPTTEASDAAAPKEDENIVVVIHLNRFSTTLDVEVQNGTNDTSLFDQEQNQDQLLRDIRRVWQNHLMHSMVGLYQDRPNVKVLSFELMLEAETDLHIATAYEKETGVDQTQDSDTNLRSRVRRNERLLEERRKENTENDADGSEQQQKTRTQRMVVETSGSARLEAEIDQDLLSVAVEASEFIDGQIITQENLQQALLELHTEHLVNTTIVSFEMMEQDSGLGIRRPTNVEIVLAVFIFSVLACLVQTRAR